MNTCKSNMGLKINSTPSPTFVLLKKGNGRFPIILLGLYGHLLRCQTKLHIQKTTFMSGRKVALNEPAPFRKDSIRVLQRIGRDLYDHLWMRSEEHCSLPISSSR